MSMTVKAYLKRGENANAEIRRFVVDETVTSSFEYLSKKVAQVFPSLVSPDNFSLAWKDSEGDEITFSSDDELLEALGQLNEDIFRIYVKGKKRCRRDQQEAGNGQSATDGSAPRGAEEEVFHPGVICDGCESRIHGPRFKCISCPDYDLCKQCEAKGVHSQHVFVKFRKPQIGRSCQGGFSHRPGMFRQFGFPGWRRWWMQQQQQQQGGAGPSTQQEQTPGGPAPGPQGGEGCSMGPGLFGGPPPQDFLKDIGQTVAQMLDPLGIDVDIDVDHQGQRTHCGGEPNVCGGRGGGRHGRRHGKGRRCNRNTWAGPEQQEEGSEVPSKERGTGKEEGAKTQADTSKDKAAEAIETGETQSSPDAGPNDGGASGASGSDDTEWTMVEDGNGKPASPQKQQQPQTAPDSSDFVYQSALNQMQAMGFDNDGGWLSSLLVAKEGDIGRVLDAIKIGSNVSFK